MNCETKQIPLTRGFVATVSSEDYEAVSRFKWHAVTINRKTYAQRSFFINGKIRTMYMHRYLMADALADGLVVDHINGDGLNNTRTNLRVLTPAQNAANNLAFTSSLRLRGVWKTKNSFAARVRHAGSIYYLGCYETANEAAFFVNQKLDELRPGFGARNKVDYDALLACLHKRKEEIDSVIDRVSREIGGNGK